MSSSFLGKWVGSEKHLLTELIRNTFFLQINHSALTTSSHTTIKCQVTNQSGPTSVEAPWHCLSLLHSCDLWLSTGGGLMQNLDVFCVSSTLLWQCAVLGWVWVLAWCNVADFGSCCKLDVMNRHTAWLHIIQPLVWEQGVHIYRRILHLQSRPIILAHCKAFWTALFHPRLK